ncbi:MAG: hypothetical protein C0410_13785 [Anaerolinea sp.]|nr:hypothetical protein [Anaerolinea sp.]
MVILKLKTKRQKRLNTVWRIDDWSAKFTNNIDLKTTIAEQEYHSNIVMGSYNESIEMTKTKHFLSESLISSKGIDGTIIIGSTTTTTDPKLHEILLNIQPLGWIYIPGGRKNENE